MTYWRTEREPERMRHHRKICAYPFFTCACVVFVACLCAYAHIHNRLHWSAIVGRTSPAACAWQTRAARIVRSFSLSDQQWCDHCLRVRVWVDWPWLWSYFSPPCDRVKSRGSVSTKTSGFARLLHHLHAWFSYFTNILNMRCWTKNVDLLCEIKKETHTKVAAS